VIAPDLPKFVFWGNHYDEKNPYTDISEPFFVASEKSRQSEITPLATGHGLTVPKVEAAPHGFALPLKRNT
jgi:hypothetical protein